MHACAHAAVGKARIEAQRFPPVSASEQLPCCVSRELRGAVATRDTEIARLRGEMEVVTAAAAHGEAAAGLRVGNPACATPLALSSPWATAT